jgi:diketogulonate reductase-like aldo/keto reductase
MRFETLPDGTSIPVLGLGTWEIGGRDAPDRTQDAAYVQTLQRLIEMGYSHLDTAEWYGGTHTEELVGQAIKGVDQASLFITTKVSPEHLRYADVHKALQGSLRRLGVDYVDLYLIHWPNRDIPLAETFRALNELVANGSVRRIGVSNFDVPLLEQSIPLCESPIATDQVRYNLLHRQPVRTRLLELCQSKGMVLTAYSPLKDAVLTHPVVTDIARIHGATPAQVAIAWLLAQKKVITIPKTANLGRARENLGALDVELSADDVARLDAIAS